MGGTDGQMDTGQLESIMPHPPSGGGIKRIISKHICVSDVIYTITSN